jgi:hypothetical protein
MKSDANNAFNNSARSIDLTFGYSFRGPTSDGSYKKKREQKARSDWSNCCQCQSDTGDLGPILLGGERGRAWPRLVFSAGGFLGSW